MATNYLGFLSCVVGALRTAGLDVWVFGGWAEELRGVRPNGPHSDIDLLLRAKTFDALEAWLARNSDLDEIVAKRFSHKRAFIWSGVRVEVFLVMPGQRWTTRAFNDRVVITWPVDTFPDSDPGVFPTVSKKALALYRQYHPQMVKARADFVASVSPSRVHLPPELRGVFFDFLWTNDVIWRLPTPASSCPAHELIWHLDLPVWSTAPPRPLFDLSPREVLGSPHQFPGHTARVNKADLNLPLELFSNEGRWIILDGYHRLARHVKTGSAQVPVRLHPDEYLDHIRKDPQH